MIIKSRLRYGDLSVNKYNDKEDKERAVTPAIVYAGEKFGNDHISVVGIGWWKWGIRLTLHWRKK